MGVYMVDTIHERPYGLAPLKPPATINIVARPQYMAYTARNTFRLNGLSNGLMVDVIVSRTIIALASRQHPCKTLLSSGTSLYFFASMGLLASKMSKRRFDIPLSW